MPINPWLITWEIVNPNNPVPANLIGAILHNQTSDADVARIMHLLYHNEGGYIAEQLRFARRDFGFKIHGHWMVGGKLHLGSSPSLDFHGTTFA